MGVRQIDASREAARGALSRAASSPPPLDVMADHNEPGRKAGEGKPAVLAVHTVGMRHPVGGTPRGSERDPLPSVLRNAGLCSSGTSPGMAGYIPATVTPPCWDGACPGLCSQGGLRGNLTGGQKMVVVRGMVKEGSTDTRSVLPWIGGVVGSRSDRMALRF